MQEIGDTRIPLLSCATQLPDWSSASRSDPVVSNPTISPSSVTALASLSTPPSSVPGTSIPVAKRAKPSVHAARGKPLALACPPSRPLPQRIIRFWHHNENHAWSPLAAWASRSHPQSASQPRHGDHHSASLPGSLRWMRRRRRRRRRRSGDA